jgi:hypothetical protein
MTLKSIVRYLRKAKRDTDKAFPQDKSGNGRHKRWEREKEKKRKAKKKDD